jgi:hypothetical protein
MNQKEISERLIVINSFLNKWEDELISLQKICTHPNASVTHDSNTGNYDPSADSHWSIHSCPDCEKMWTEDED